MKLGGASNVVLGVGDPERFSLLGGSFGQSGDVVNGGTGFGARFFRNAKSVILAAAAARSGGGSSGMGGGGPNQGAGGTGSPRPIER